jgi:hypothetical protein
MLLAVALSSGFPLPTKIVKEGILFPASAALLTGRFFRLGSAKTNKAEMAKLRGNGDMEENAVLADARTR